jgi:hypothetical protein
MNQKILENLNSPAELEKLYRSNKNEFGQAFKHIYETQEMTPVLAFWNSRLNYNDNRTSLNSKKEFRLTIILIIIAGLIANIVNIKGVNQELFLSRNISFIIIPFVSAFFLWKQNAKINVKIILTVLFGISALYINLLPNSADSSSINLVYIHLPIFLWCVLGYAYMNDAYANNEKRIDFLKYNGDLLVISVILFLAGMLFTVLTIGLFELIGMNIAKFYFEYI